MVSKSQLGFDFTPSLGAAADAVLTPSFRALGRGLGAVTIVFPLLANLWLLRRAYRQLRFVPIARMSGRDWVRGYALWTFVACLIANTISQAPAMSWHNLVAFHAAVLPVVLWLDALQRTRVREFVRRGLAAYGVLSVTLLAGECLGSNQYRRAGRDAIAFTPRPDHALVHQLGLADHARKREWPRMPQHFYRTYIAPNTRPPDAPRGARSPVPPRHPSLSHRARDRSTRPGLSATSLQRFLSFTCGGAA